MGAQNPPSPVVFGQNNMGTNLLSGIMHQGTGRTSQYEGPINYFLNPTLALNATTNFTLGTVGTLTNGLPTGTPTFGSGASGTLSLSIDSSSALLGTYALNYTDSASTTAGNMVASAVLNIDPLYKARQLNFSVGYTCSSAINLSGTSSNTFAWAAWDVTNSVWLSSWGNFNMVQSPTGIITGSFQTGATTTQVRIVIYNIVSFAGGLTLKLSGFMCSPQVTNYAPAMTDWISFTPSGSWVTTASYLGKYRRVGDTMEGQIVITLSGAATATPLTVNLPTGLNIDSTKLANGTDTTQIVGDVRIIAAGNEYVLGAVRYNTATALNVRGPGSGTVTTSLSVDATHPATFASADSISIKFAVPIVGWSSNSASSADSVSRLVTWQGNSNSVQAVASATDTQVTGWSSIADTAGAFSSNQYVVPVTGSYDINYTLFFASNTASLPAAIQMRLYKNGSNFWNIPTAVQATAACYKTGLFNATLSFNAGDIIQFHVYQDTGVSQTLNGGAITHTASISLRSSPAIIYGADSVNGCYKDTSGATISTFGTFTYTTKVKDSHNAYSGGTLTIPVSGEYRFSAKILSATVTLTTTTEFSVYISRNGTIIDSDQRPGSGGTSMVYAAGVTFNYPCLQGDTITVSVASGVATTGSTVYGTIFSWERVGN